LDSTVRQTELVRSKGEEMCCPSTWVTTPPTSSARTQQQKPVRMVLFFLVPVANLFSGCVFYPQKRDKHVPRSQPSTRSTQTQPLYTLPVVACDAVEAGLPFDSLQQGTILLGHQCTAAPGRIHVHPEIVLGAQVGNLLQWIERTNYGGARRGRHHERERSLGFGTEDFTFCKHEAMRSNQYRK
uniref:Uncharacterized protein n=1 Tax=Anopheles coluzzii TaxID=1518534 RepID=A0A8W7Q012_ANOCL